MGMAMDIKRLGDDIVASYDMRVKAIGELVKDTNNMIKRFHAEHKGTTKELKVFLTKGENDRVKDFKAMMSDVEKFVTDTVEGTARLMKEIQKEQKDRDKEQKDRDKEVADLMQGFKAEREEMAVNWHRLSETMYKRRGGRASVAAAEEARVLKK